MARTSERSSWNHLESNYKFRAAREDMELLILKVMPLLSINSKVFIRSLITAFHGYKPVKEPQSTEDFQHYWCSFLKQVLEGGNLLLGPFEFCGRTSHSWLLDWPRDGFYNTDIFRYLQWAGEYGVKNLTY